ncbi:MAG: TonB-dependent receptor [Acidobacteria bacterium]|nr:TonB-dependent receptor [Acidobacteriota bacterium]
MRSKQSIVAISAFVFCLVLPAVAHAQLATGTITGTVQDRTNAVIPGANVILATPGVIGGSQQSVTDERGLYQFIRLVPGTYTVRAELPGFRAAVHEGIVVNAQVTVRVDLVLEVGELTDTVTVTGEAPLLDTASVLNQAVLDRAVLDKLPTGNDLWSIGRMVPGVIISKYDIGGSESFQQSGLSSHGSPGGERMFSIDGLNVNWPGNSIGNYYDTNMFQEMNYQAGGISAESAYGGVVVNMVTKTGTNNVHGSFMFTGTNEHLQGRNLTPALRESLLKSVPARALAANPALEPVNKIQGMFEVATSLSGPIIRDHLWFSTSGNINSLNQIATGSYNADGTLGIDDNRIKNFWFKPTWQINDANQLQFTYNRNYKHRYHRRGSPFTENRAATAQLQDGHTTVLKWSSTLSPRAVMDALVGYNIIYFPTGPQPEVKPGDLSRFDIVTQVLSVAAPTYSYSPGSRAQVSASASYFTGQHDLKLGYQYERAMNRNVQYSMSHYPSGMQARFRNGVPDSVILYSTPTDTRRFFSHNAFYIQDKWIPTRKLTLNLGFRIEDTHGWVAAACQSRGAFVEERCYPKVSDIPNWLDFSPRFGLVYDVFGDGRTAVKIGASRYNTNIGTGHQGRVDPSTTAQDTRPWSDRNGDGIPQLDELGLGTGFDFGQFNRYSPDLKRPYHDEYSITIQQELPAQIVVSAAYYHREIGNEIGSVNVRVPRETYIPITVTEVTSGRQVTVYNLAPSLRTARDILWNNFDELDGFYNGVDLTVNKRFSNRWMVMSALSIGGNITDTAGTSDRNDPNFTFRRGRASNDVPVSFKLAGTYEFPLGISLSTNVQHFTGFPEAANVLVTRASVPTLTRTSQRIQVEPAGASRLPDVNLIDISLRKTFRFAERLTVEPALNVYNMGNSNAIQERTTQLGPSYHQVGSILQPRFLKLGVNINF